MVKSAAKKILFSLLLMVVAVCLPLVSRGEDDEPRRSGFVPLPVLFYTPETGFGGGAAFVFYYRLPDEPTASRASNLNFVGFYTVRNQYVLSLTPSFYWGNETWHLDTKFTHRKFPAKFFGLGPNTHPQNEEYFTPLNYQMNGYLLHRWAHFLYTGPAYDFYYYDIIKTENGGLLEKHDILGRDGGWANGLGLKASWDTRDNAMQAYTGAYYSAQAMYYDPHFGGNYGFNRFTVDLRRYVQVHEEQVLAFQLIGQSILGDPPFVLLSTIGGGNLLRGIYEGRYRDLSFGAAQVDYRFPLWGRLRGGIFAGAGDVAERINFLYIPNFKYSVGGGLRYMFDKAERVGVRFDVGYSADGPAFYFVMGEAF